MFVDDCDDLSEQYVSVSKTPFISIWANEVMDDGKVENHKWEEKYIFESQTLTQFPHDPSNFQPSPTLYSVPSW